MKIIFDTEKATITVEKGNQQRQIALDTPEAFALVSKIWLRVGWDVKYVYSFTWLGRPIIQLPEDMVRLQEVIYRVKPDVIVETGIAHGGALVFYAGLCRLMGKGRVIGVERTLRDHNRAALQRHELSDLITLVDGDSEAPSTVANVKEHIRPNDVGNRMVFLDSNHSKVHVLAELDAYAPMVATGSYIVVMDGIMADLTGAPRSEPDWAENNPRNAAREWTKRNAEFKIVEPPFVFNEGSVRDRVDVLA